METMREKMQAAAAVMKERGMVVETYEIGQPAAEHLVKGGGEVLVVLPTRMVISMKRPDGALDVHRRFQNECERLALHVL